MSKHHDAAKWTSKVKKARANLRAQMPLPCVECGGLVTNEMPWDVGHLQSISQGGDISQYGASHRSCNRSAGGKLGASIINKQKKNTRAW